MVTREYVQQQLKLIGYKVGFFNKAEVNELVNILMPNENIYECVNGYYEGGYALLVVTNDRLLLIDKKPLQFLTIEDVRFTQISQIFYNNRLIGAFMSIFFLGVKNLKFNSLNKTRLRNLVIQVQNLISQYKNLGNLQANQQKDSLEILSKKIDLYLKLHSSLNINNQSNQNDHFVVTNQLEDLRSYGRKAILEQAKLSQNNSFLEQYKVNNKKKTILSLGRLSLID